MKTAQMRTEVNNVWQRSISRGNAETSVNCYGNAILLFNQALDHALYNFDDLARHSVDQAVSQVLIAKFSLADCYKSLELYERSAECYISAAEFLVRTSTCGFEREALACAVKHAFHHCNVLWMEFVSMHGKNVSVTSQERFCKLARQIMDREIELSVCH